MSHISTCKMLRYIVVAAGSGAVDAGVRLGVAAAAMGDDDNEPFCAGCDRWFVDLASLYKHLAASLKYNRYFGCSCDFSSQSSFEQVSPTLAFCFIY